MKKIIEIRNEMLITTDTKINDIRTIEFLKEELKMALFKDHVENAAVEFTTEKECNFNMTKVSDASYKMDSEYMQFLFITDEDSLERVIEEYADAIADLKADGRIPA